MRHALRVAVLSVTAYLLQASLLSYFKINGVMIDVMAITAYSIGYAYGIYPGLMSGMIISLIVEVTSGDPAGLSLVYVAIGYLGAWIVGRMRTFTRVGNRAMEQNIKRFAPLVFLAILAVAKESVYLAYFYLTGMDIAFGHVLKVLLAGLIMGVAALPLLPLLIRFLRRGPEDTFLAKRRARKLEKAKARPVGVEREGKKERKPKERKKGAQGAKESFLSMLNPVLDELNEPAVNVDMEQEEEEQTPDDGMGLSMEDMLGMPLDEDPTRTVASIGKKPSTKPGKRELTEDELAIYKRPTKNPPADETPEDMDDDDDDEQPDGEDF